MNKHLSRLTVGTLLLIGMNDVRATEFEKMGSALNKVLRTTKALKKTVQVNGKDVDVFYSEQGGAPSHVAVIQKAVYPPDCTHTWVIGTNAEDATIEQIRTVEMKCPHAFPTNKAVFLDQYKGKGPADIKKLKDEVQTIAKATGTSNLTTDAVIVSIKATQKLVSRSVAKERD
jgi:hypothetical protein